jgi:serine phosphatase RsbU (regulator of sigma subunit)
MKPLAGRLPGPALRIRLSGAAVLALLVALTWLGAPWTERLQGTWFDWHQALSPRRPTQWPVTVVAIDAESLRAHGQWPWPRTLLARLLDIVVEAGPAAIGLNVLMPEADALSPERLLAAGLVDDAAVAAALRALPSNDARLATSLARAPVVLAVAGSAEPTGATLRAAPVMVRSVHAGGAAPPEPAVPRYRGALVSIDELDRQADGWGLTSVEVRRGVIRRVPLVAGVGQTLVPTLALEMLRVAQRAPALRLAVSDEAVTGVSVGALDVPADADGGLRPHFAPHDAARFVSAAQVLAEKVDPARFRDRLVLIGPTALGLQEQVNTPVGERLSGTEIHSQVLENLVDGSWLRRPPWASTAEALLLLALGTLLLWGTPRLRPFPAALLMFGCVAGPAAAAYALYRSQRLLFDAATPGIALLLLFFVLLVLSLAEVTRQGRQLQAQVQAQREQGARIAGELLAAQRVQMATLPDAAAFATDPRLELDALLTPAREVGGDLYDFFMLDGHRLFLLVGDVAGKGLSASIFMAVSKALVKSAMLRTSPADLGAVMRAADAEISRENAQALFVTVFAAILDLDSGRLDYCNAGHDNPFRLHRSFDAPRRIDDGDGPPLCAAPGYPYQGASCRLLPGERLCLMTDGVSEAQNAAGELFGPARVEQAMRTLQQQDAGANAVVRTLLAAVQDFVGGADPADDLTLLALRWRGPGGAEAAR